jgi:hypothetical protein
MEDEVKGVLDRAGRCRGAGKINGPAKLASRRGSSLWGQEDASGRLSNRRGVQRAAARIKGRARMVVDGRIDEELKASGEVEVVYRQGFGVRGMRCVEEENGHLPPEAS